MSMNISPSTRILVHDVETDLTSPGAFLSFLQHEQQQQDENNETVLHTQGPCIMMPRVRYGSVESTIEEIHDNVSHSINASAFTTLRFRKYGNPMQKRMHGAGKTLLDVSRISAQVHEKEQSSSTHDQMYKGSLYQTQQESFGRETLSWNVGTIQLSKGCATSRQYQNQRGMCRVFPK